MARLKKTTTETDALTDQLTPLATDITPFDEIDPPTDPNPEPEPEPEPTLELDYHTEGILRTFTSHESLFVDLKGGTYTSDTKAQIRGNAILYQNPYYQP